MAPDPTAIAPPDAPAHHASGWRVGLRWLAIGFALSLPVHAAVVAWLALTHVARPGSPTARESLVERAVVGDDGGAGAGEAESGGGTPEGPAADDRSAPTTDAVAGAPVLGGSAGGTGLAGGGQGGGDGGAGGGMGGGTGSGTGLGGGTGGTSFFGVSGRGTRFAFIVDKSGSMSSDGRLVQAKAELLRAIAALPDYASVFVVFYDSGEPWTFSDGKWERVKGSTVRRLESKLRDVGPSGGTNPMPAFRLVYALDPRPDFIFFLSDGEIPDDCAAEIRRLNSRGRKVTISSIAFGDEAGGARLREVAEDAGGEFREVRSRPRGAGARP